MGVVSEGRLAVSTMRSAFCSAASWRSIPSKWHPEIANASAGTTLISLWQLVCRARDSRSPAFFFRTDQSGRVLHANAFASQQLNQERVEHCLRALLDWNVSCFPLTARGRLSNQPRVHQLK